MGSNGLPSSVSDFFVGLCKWFARAKIYHGSLVSTGLGLCSNLFYVLTLRARYSSQLSYKGLVSVFRYV